MSECLVNRRSTIFLPFRIQARWASSASAYPKLNRERLVTLLTRQNTSFVYVGRPVSSLADTKTDGWHRLFASHGKKKKFLPFHPHLSFSVPEGQRSNFLFLASRFISSECVVGTCRVGAEQKVTRGGIKWTQTLTHTHRRQNETACLGVLVEECVSPISYAYSFTPNSTVTSCRNYGALSDLTYQHTCTHRERIPQLVRGRCGIGGSASILRSGGGEEQFVQRREGALSSRVLVMCETHVQCRDSDGFCARAEKKVKAAEQDPTKKRKKGGVGGAN